MGVKLYGVCVIIYEKIKSKTILEIEEFVQKWREDNLKLSDIELATSSQRQLVHYQEVLLKAKNGAFENEEADPENFIREIEEKIATLQQEVNTHKFTLPFNVENLYEPKCIGVLSHWPWYDLLKDWLCELISLVKSPTELKALPIERYIITHLDILSI